MPFFGRWTLRPGYGEKFWNLFAVSSSYTLNARLSYDNTRTKLKENAMNITLKLISTKQILNLLLALAFAGHRKPRKSTVAV